MGRKIILRREGEVTGQILEESQASDEAQLQEQLKENPDLLPIEEYELSGPLMVVGRETTLPSGSVDLTCLTKSGDLVLVEFKTGPQNPDFRHVLAQLLDYGSHMWGMEYEVFEETVARSYFESNRCPPGSPVRKKPSIEEAARATWTDLSEDEFSEFKGNLTRNLGDGRFRYLTVAQRFTETMLKTVEYLNAKMQDAQFYAVELVRFTGGSISAFEARTVLKPQRPIRERTGTIGRERFLEAFANEDYRNAVRDFLEAAEGLNIRLEWGSQGMSIRIPVPNKADGLSIGWLFPPGSWGWMGVNDVTLGFDRKSAMKYAEEILAHLSSYSNEISRIPEAKKVSAANLEAFQFTSETFVKHRDDMVAAIRTLVEKITKSE